MRFHSSTFRTLYSLFQILGKDSKSKFLRLLLFMLCSSVLEPLSVLAIIPFMSLIKSPITASLGDFISQASFFVIIFSLASLSRYTAMRYTLLLSADFGHLYGTSIFLSFINQPFLNFQQSDNRNLDAYLTKFVDSLMIFISNTLQLVLSLIQVLFILVVLFYVDRSFTLYSFTLLPLLYYISLRLSRIALTDNSRQLKYSLLQRRHTIDKSIEGFRDLRANSLQPAILSDFKVADSNVWTLEAKNLLIGSIPRFIIEPLGYVFLVALIIFALYYQNLKIFPLVKISVFLFGLQKIVPLLQLSYSSWSRSVSCEPQVKILMSQIKDNASVYDLSLIHI